MRTVPVAMVIVCAAAFAGLVSCGGEKARDKQAEAAAEQILEKTGGNKVAIQDGGNKVKVQGKDVDVEMSQTSAWPADMFADVPEFTSATVQRVHKGTEGGSRRFNIFFAGMTEGSLAEYETALKQRGWTTHLITMGGQGGMLSAEKGDLGINFAYNKQKGDGMLAVFSSASE